MVTTLWQDLTHGARLLRKNPGFAFVAMASIAIGVGANAAMFSLADTLVLRPLTVPRASEIVTLSAVVPTSGFLSPTSSALSYPDYEDVRDQARSFDSLVAFRLIVASFADRADQPAQRKFGMAVSGNLFDALGIQAARGRSLTAEDDRRGHDRRRRYARWFHWTRSVRAAGVLRSVCDHAGAHERQRCRRVDEA
jgi:putative ABC transport system permease protein